jgi:hypothetical protein
MHLETKVEADTLEALGPADSRGALLETIAAFNAAIDESKPFDPTQSDAELGPGYAFPTKGWESYAMHEGSTRCLLSALYRDEVLVAVDYYVAPANRVPELRVRNFGQFRFVPGQIMIGGDMLRLDDRFAAVAEGPDNRTYSHSFEVRFPDGIAFVQGTGGHVQRLVLYAMG